MTQNIILQSIVYIWWCVCWPPSLINFHLRRSNIFNTYHIRVTVLDLIVRVAFIYVHGIDQPKNKWPGTFCAGPEFFPWVVLRNNFVSRGRGGYMAYFWYVTKFVWWVEFLDPSSCMTPSKICVALELELL